MCVCAKLLNILINYLNFLIIKFCDGVKAESEKTNPCNRLESSEAARAGYNASHQG